MLPEQRTNSTIPIAPKLHLRCHSEPFGCTYDGCNKVFGSKNDWKRHESSQHHQLECWKCDIRSHTRADTANTCGKCFFRKADFVKHLKVIHGNTDGQLANPLDHSSTTGGHIQTTITTTRMRDVFQILVDCHIPKYHGGASWCGFCRKVIKLHGKAGIEKRDKRLDHIAWHFEKDNLRIKDGWVPLEEPSPDDGQKATGVLGTKYGKESSEGEDEEDVELINSLPKRRHTEPKTLSSFSTHSESTLETGKLEGARWYCQTPPHADMSTPPPAFISPSHTLIELRPYEVDEVLLVLVNHRNDFPDPWSPELAHAFPWNVRRVALAEFLDGLEPSLPNTNI